MASTKKKRGQAAKAESLFAQVEEFVDQEKNGALLKKLVSLITEDDTIYKMGKVEVKTIQTKFKDLAWFSKEIRHAPKQHHLAIIEQQARMQSAAEDIPMVPEVEYTIRDEQRWDAAFTSVSSQFAPPRDMRDLRTWFNKTRKVLARRPHQSNAYYTENFLRYLTNVMLMVEQINFCKENGYDIENRPLPILRDPIIPFRDPTGVPFNKDDEKSPAHKDARMVQEHFQHSAYFRNSIHDHIRHLTTRTQSISTHISRGLSGHP
ncbi:hypothetical protein VTL71DRAFT_9807 [Oculimacula yallundae]|uniref:Uncharacterized protein n=1 Tax=Oculimacula yallundae TaxID=86028 RepID=A0ABR4BQP7_9HELO